MSKEEKKELSEIRKTTHEELTDMVVEGFERLDDNILDRRPPKITWMEGFEKKEDRAKIEYLKKLASTMNNAARLIQDERDALVKLMVKKEAQLAAMQKQMRQNDEVLQKQLISMNAQKQHASDEISRLAKRLRQYELAERNQRIAERKATIEDKEK
jgi:hypothetical protein